MPSQWIALGLVTLVIGGFLYAFFRSGNKIKSDPENKPPSDMGAQPPD